MRQEDPRIPEGARLEADICIVGAGPTGIALARACAAMGISVLLLESGGGSSASWAQDLNAGAVIGDRYDGLQSTRHRGLGGTAALWNSLVRDVEGAKYVPLDRSDFLSGGLNGDADWPIGYPDLIPFYRAAQAVCGLGPLAYDAEHWTENDRAPIALPDDRMMSAIYQYGRAGLFTREYVAELQSSSQVHLYQDATVFSLTTDPAKHRVTEVRIRSRSGGESTVRAGVFVLAAGAIENTRLLLAMGNESGWLGHCFMEHPRDSALVLLPADDRFYERAGFYDIHPAADGTVIAGRFLLTGAARVEAGLPNASVSLVPRRRRVAGPVGRMARLFGAVARMGSRGSSDQVGWSRRPDASRVFDGVLLYGNLEQRPHRENRLVLSSEVDRLGVRRIELHWHWRPEEQAGLERFRSLLREVFEGAGLGRVLLETGARPDPNAHHHSGTTRMSRSDRDGVVDPDCRVHGSDNLYVVGASVFPTSGYANPTLTCVALALRLAGHLGGVLGVRGAQHRAG